jgi:methylglyoxal synthase
MFTSLVSIASESNNTRPAKLVTASDEAFALLLFDNCIDNWIKMAKMEKHQTKNCNLRNQGTTRTKRKKQRQTGDKKVHRCSSKK